MGWIKPPLPFIDPAGAPLGAASQFDCALRAPLRMTQKGGDMGWMKPPERGDLFERVVGAPTPTGVMGEATLTVYRSRLVPRRCFAVRLASLAQDDTKRWRYGMDQATRVVCRHRRYGADRLNGSSGRRPLPV